MQRYKLTEYPPNFSATKPERPAFYLEISFCMKKIILLLAIALSAAFSISAMSLKEAFKALSNVPNISVRTDYDTPILGLVVNGQIAKAENLNRSQILESGNAALTILNQVPLTWMINGGNNNLVAAFVYASPESTDGIYETLMILMSGEAGDITVIHGGIYEAARNAFQNAPLKMEGASIKIQATLPNGDTYNIEAD